MPCAFLKLLSLIASIHVRCLGSKSVVLPRHRGIGVRQAFRQVGDLIRGRLHHARIWLQHQHLQALFGLVLALKGPERVERHGALQLVEAQVQLAQLHLSIP